MVLCFKFYCLLGALHKKADWVIRLFLERATKNRFLAVCNE